jgi:hypothetical protein
MAVPDLFTMTIESGDRVFLCEKYAEDNYIAILITIE